VFVYSTDVVPAQETGVRAVTRVNFDLVPMSLFDLTSFCLHYFVADVLLSLTVKR